MLSALTRDVSLAYDLKKSSDRNKPLKAVPIDMI